MALTDQDIADLVVGTLEELGRMRFNQIAAPLQNYEVMGRIIREDRVEFQSGVGIQRTLQVQTNGNARRTTLFGTDNTNVGDTLKQINVPWRHYEAFYSFDRRELLMNRGASLIVSMLKSRRSESMIDLAELGEEDFWNKPTDSTDKVRLFGVPYWVVKNATEGHNGGNASGFTDGPGGLDSATFTTWKNYTAQYTNVTKADLIKKLRTAYRKIRFKSPVDVNDFRVGRGDQYRLYTTESVISSIEDLGEAQNENLGRDIASMDETITFRRNPIIWVPELDADAQNPVYMLNFAYFRPVFLRGDYLRESAPKMAANQHNVMDVFIDLTWNILCTDRRAQAVLNIA